jgi:hypothetical protein
MSAPLLRDLVARGRHFIRGVREKQNASESPALQGAVGSSIQSAMLSFETTTCKRLDTADSRCKAFP